MADFEKAATSLILDDGVLFTSAFEKAADKAASLNKRARSRAIGGADVPASCDVAEGDTYLHVAMRNQKWRVRAACVRLGCDPRIANAAGETAPRMQLNQSFPRFMMCFLPFFLCLNPPDWLAGSVSPAGRNVAGNQQCTLEPAFRGPERLNGAVACSI